MEVDLKKSLAQRKMVQMMAQNEPRERKVSLATKVSIQLQTHCTKCMSFLFKAIAQHRSTVLSKGPHFVYHNLYLK